MQKEKENQEILFQGTVNVAGILNNTAKIKKISVCIFTILLQIKTKRYSNIKLGQIYLTFFFIPDIPITVFRTNWNDFTFICLFVCLISLIQLVYCILHRLFENIFSSILLLIVRNVWWQVQILFQSQSELSPTLLRTYLFIRGVITGEPWVPRQPAHSRGGRRHPKKKPAARLFFPPASVEPRRDTAGEVSPAAAFNLTFYSTEHIFLMFIWTGWRFD